MFLHVLTEFQGPPIAIADCGSFAGIFILLDSLPNGIQPKRVFFCLACRITPGRQVFEIDVLEVIVQ